MGEFNAGSWNLEQCHAMWSREHTLLKKLLLTCSWALVEMVCINLEQTPSDHASGNAHYKLDSVKPTKLRSDYSAGAHCKLEIGH